jgi:hypothetical protein
MSSHPPCRNLFDGDDDGVTFVETCGDEGAEALEADDVIRDSAVGGEWQGIETGDLEPENQSC